jgi:hypothetical protein
MKKASLFLFYVLAISSIYSQTSYFFQIETSVPNVKEKSYIEFQCNDNYLRFNRPGAKYSAIKLIDTKNNICIFTPYDAKRKWYILEELDTIFGKQSKVNKTGEKSKIGAYDCEKFTSDCDYMGMKITYTFWTTQEKIINPIFNKYIIGLVTDGKVNTDIGFLIKLEVVMNNTKGDKIVKQGTSNVVNLSRNKLIDETMPWLNNEYKEGILFGTESNWGNSTTPASSSTSISCPWTTEFGSVYEDRLRKLVLRITGKKVEKFSRVSTIGF